jgi:hypothetical protein
MRVGSLGLDDARGKSVVDTNTEETEGSMPRCGQHQAFELGSNAYHLQVSLYLFPETHPRAVHHMHKCNTCSSPLSMTPRLLLLRCATAPDTRALYAGAESFHLASYHPRTGMVKSGNSSSRSVPLFVLAKDPYTTKVRAT